MEMGRARGDDTCNRSLPTTSRRIRKIKRVDKKEFIVGGEMNGKAISRGRGTIKYV